MWRKTVPNSHWTRCDWSQLDMQYWLFNWKLFSRSQNNRTPVCSMHQCMIMVTDLHAFLILNVSYQNIPTGWNIGSHTRPRRRFHTLHTQLVTLHYTPATVATYLFTQWITVRHLFTIYLRFYLMIFCHFCEHV